VTRGKQWIAVVVISALVNASLASAGGSATPPKGEIVRCLRSAGFDARAIVADGATLIVATSAKITWTISLAGGSPHAGWTAYRASPTPRQRASLARCLK